MTRLGARPVAHFALLLSLSTLTTALPASAATSLAPPASPQALAQVWAGAEAELAQASADRQRIAAEPPAAELLLQARRQLQLEEAAFRFRDAARLEQVVVYAMAVDPQVQAAAESMLPQQQVPTIRYTIDGLRSLWHAAGIADFSTVHIRHNRDFTESAPVDDLTGFYKVSGSRHSIDWSYLASINYVESDFGRVNGPSSAGAVGPMQFMPGTWSDYGNGGDVMSPRDSIEAAARYLRAMGGPANMDRAIYRYNNDADYVASIQGFAAAFRSDPSWLGRVYYWSTWG
jgi:hypothetical protein